MPRAFRQHSNRELFRAVNEQIAELASRFAAARDGPVAFVCECSRVGCAEQIQTRLDVYAKVRETPGAYLVVLGHEVDGEETVFGSGGYLIVLAPVDNGASET